MPLPTFRVLPWIASLALASPALAAVEVEYSLTAQGDSGFVPAGSQNVTASAPNAGPIGSAICCLQSFSDTMGNRSESTAEVAIGTIRLFSDADATAQGITQNGGDRFTSASSQGSWEDAITIVIQGGGSGTLVGNVLFDGAISTFTDAVDPGENLSSDVVASLSLFSGIGTPPNDFVAGFDQGILDFNGTQFPPSGDAFGVYPVSIPFNSGVPTRLLFGGGVLVQTSSQASSSMAATGLATGAGEFRNTFAWAGITDVLDGAGNSVGSNYTITSDSGYDYVVPEPTGAGALLAGLAGLISLAARRPGL